MSFVTLLILPPLQTVNHCNRQLFEVVSVFLTQVLTLTLYVSRKHEERHFSTVESSRVPARHLACRDSAAPNGAYGLRRFPESGRLPWGCRRGSQQVRNPVQAATHEAHSAAAETTALPKPRHQHPAAATTTQRLLRAVR